MDPQVRQRVLRQITYGLYVVTTRHGDQIAAGTVNWVTQASLEPPLVVVGMKNGSGIAALTDQSRRFAINILGVGQKETAAAFFKPTTISGDRMNGIRFRYGEFGLPILLDLPSACECSVEEIVRRGDHDIVVGRVTGIYEHLNVPPLSMASTGWYYGG